MQARVVQKRFGLNEKQRSFVFWTRKDVEEGLIKAHIDIFPVLHRSHKRENFCNVGITVVSRRCLEIES